MKLGNQITILVNRIEDFARHSSVFFMPLKIMCWALLLFFLMITNFIAIVRWPFSSIASRWKNKRKTEGTPIEVKSQAELEEAIANNELVLVDFWAQWCGPCLLMTSAIEDVAKEHQSTTAVIKVDVSIDQAMSKSYAVRGLPTVIMFKRGIEMSRISGALTHSQLTEIVEQAKK